MNVLISAEEFLAGQLREKHIRVTRQYPYAKGRKFKADFYILDTNILVEVNGGIWRTSGKNGGAHGSISGILKDIERLNLATLNGYALLRFTPSQVEDGSAITFILKVIRG